MTSFEYNRVDAIHLVNAQYRGGTSSINLAVRTHQLETLQMNNTVRELERRASAQGHPLRYQCG